MILFHLFFYLNLISDLDSSIINSKLGAIKGTTLLSRNGRKFHAYMGVPYAKPPINELRFKDPQPVEPWQCVLDATNYPPRCPQAPGPKGYEGQEDCLYLNIYTPPQIKEPLPVWVFIYGGRRISGHVAPYKHGPHYIMDKDVIFITMTYRIGPLGYLSTEDNVISGNYGLKDEIMVLKWIQEHVISFGGDPTNVTISGGSNGGIDVSLLLASPMAKGLFHRAISQSGHPLNSIRRHGLARKTAWELGRLLNCGSNRTRTSEQLLKCLRNISAEDMIMKWTLCKDKSLTFTPVVESRDVEHRVFHQQPRDALAKANNIPWMVGINKDEGTVGGCAISNLFSSPNVHQILKNNLPNLLKYTESPKKEIITKHILETYLNSRNPAQLFKGYSKIYAVVFFTSGVIDTAKLYNGLVYFYVYAHKNNPSYLQNYYARSAKCNYDAGVIHGEELRSLQFYPALLPPVISGQDRIVSDQVISLWYNFVKQGNPNHEDLKIWKPVISSNIEHLFIRNGNLKMKIKPFWKQYQGWTKFLQS